MPSMQQSKRPMPAMRPAINAEGEDGEERHKWSLVRLFLGERISP
jgi:hypothetical protein